MTKAQLENELDQCKQRIPDLETEVMSKEKEIEAKEKEIEAKEEVFKVLLANYRYYLAFFKYLKEVLKTKKFVQLFSAVEIESKKDIKKAVKNFEAIPEKRQSELELLIEVSCNKYEIEYEEAI